MRAAAAGDSGAPPLCARRPRRHPVASHPPTPQHPLFCLLPPTAPPPAAAARAKPPSDGRPPRRRGRLGHACARAAALAAAAAALSPGGARPGDGEARLPARVFAALRKERLAAEKDERAAPACAAAVARAAGAGEEGRRALAEAAARAAEWASAEAAALAAVRAAAARAPGLARLRENAAEARCLCCSLPFAPGEPVHVLVRCCQITVCLPCAFPGGVCAEACPNCLAPVGGASGVPVLALGAAEAEAVEALAAGADADAAAGGPEEGGEAADKKHAAVAALALGAEGEEEEGLACVRDERDVPPFVGGLLQQQAGDKKGAAERGARCVLVFTSFPESSRALCRALAAFPGAFLRLSGTPAQKAAALAAAADCRRAGRPAVVVATSFAECAGMHMPFVTHVVLFHRIASGAVATQVVARAQRLGRAGRLEVVQFLDADEADPGP